MEKMNPNQPWVKILKTAKNESKAKAISEKLMKRYDIVATLPPQGNSTPKLCRASFRGDPFRAGTSLPWGNMRIRTCSKT